MYPTFLVMLQPSVQQQQRVQRTVLFMDIRGFTSWSEAKSPEMVVTMLNEFYEMAEQIVAAGGGTKPHFIGDEVMAVAEVAEINERTGRVKMKCHCEVDGKKICRGDAGVFVQKRPTDDS